MRYCRHCLKNVEVSLDAFSNIEICSICGIAMGDFNLPPGTILGGFQIEAEMSHDMLGTVYKARQLNLERNIALKTLSPQLAQDLDFVDHFFEQARAAAGLNHPNIVQIFDAGSTPEGIYYLAMELIEGETLASRIKREGSLPPETALDIAIKVADALGYAWEKLKLSHGDIKPANIIMNSSGDPKLSDMGLARSQTEEKNGKTALQLFYTAPELISGELANSDMRSDIYSFGATLYHMLAGVPPFPEADPEKLCDMHLNATAVPLNHKSSDIDNGISDFISKMLAKKPSERPGSWTEILSAMEELLLNRDNFHQHGHGSTPRDEKKLMKLALGLGTGVIILTLLTMGLFITKHRNTAPSHADTEQKKLASKWEKLKASTKFLAPGNAINEVEKYIQNEKNNVPPDAQAYLDYLKKKKAEDEATLESKKEFQNSLEELHRKLKEANIDNLQFSKLREFKNKINSITSKAKEAGFQQMLTEKDLAFFNSNLKNIESILEKLKEQELKKAAREESERIKKENENEKKSKTEYEQKRKQISEENIISDDYTLRIYEIMKNPAKKPTTLQLAQTIEEFFKSYPDKIPGNTKEQCETLKVALATPMNFTEIMAKCDSLFKGISLPVKSLQEAGYKIDGADITGIKLMLDSGQAKIGKKIKWNTLKNEEFYEIIKSVLLAPGNADKIDPDLKKLIIVNLLLIKKNQEAETVLSKLQTLSDSDKKNWHDIIEFFTNIDSETAALVLWHDFAKSQDIPEHLRNNLAQCKNIFSDTEDNPLALRPAEKFICFNNKYSETMTYQRYSFLINDFLATSEEPSFQAILLIRKMEPELKSGNIYKALDLLMSAQARYGNAIHASKALRAFVEKQKASTLSRIREASSIKSETDNKLPFYYWENEVPGDALLYRNILAKNKIIQSSTMLTCITASAEIDSGDWSNARSFIKNNRNFAELASTKGAYINWIPPLLFGAGTIAARYNDSRLLSELADSLENISRSSDDESIKPLSSALAMELFLTSRNSASIISIAESYKFPAQPSKNDSRIALLHLLALLQQENVNANEFAKSLDHYQKLFAKEALLKSDFQWCRFVSNMIRSNDLPALQEIDSLEKLDCFAKNICAVMLADALAMKLCKNPALAKSPSTARLFRVISSKITNNMVAGDLLNRLNLIQLALSSEPGAILQAIKNILSDTRIPAITSYPQLIILKSGMTILKNPNSADEEKVTLKKFLEASVLPSDSEMYCTSIIAANDSDDYIKNMLSNNSYQQAFTAGTFNILVNANNSKNVQATIKLLTDNSASLTWQEKLFLKKLENILK